MTRDTSTSSAIAPPRELPRDLLTRREAIRRVSALLGGTALVGQSAFLSGCATSGAASASSAAPFVPFTGAEIAFLDEIAETILPATLTPGAKAAGVGPFIALMVAETYDPVEQRDFRAGLITLEQECADEHGVGFMAATPAQRLALVERLDAEQVAYARTRAGRRGPHYFRMLKELTLLGYFTSEIGYTEAMRYVEAPGHFDPCVPYAPGDKTWAPHA